MSLLDDSLLAFITAASADCGSSRGLHWAYQNGGYATKMKTEDKPRAYCYLDKDDATHCNRTELKKANWKTYTADKTSGQELLGKAILAYNRGTAGLSARHYFADTIMLKSDPNLKANGQSFDYWMQIKKITQTRAGITGYVPYVTYLWEGSLGFDVNKDGEVKDIVAIPDAVPPVEAVIETTIPWCFLYGEKDWIGPIKDLLTKKYLDFEGYKKLAVAQKARRISCE